MTQSSWEHLSTPGGFDDPSLKRQNQLQQHLHQSVPPVGDGGREILWWCPQCQTAWHQRGYLPPRTHLSEQEMQRLAHRFSAPDLAPATLPQALCPACTHARWGGTATLEETLGQPGYCLSWESGKLRLLLVCALIAIGASASSDERDEAFYSLTDVPLPDSRLRATLSWLARLAAPDSEERVLPLSPHYQEQLSRWWQLDGTSRWSGYAWRAAESPLGPGLVLLALISQPGEEPGPLPLLLACWRHIAPVMEHILWPVG